MREIEFHGHRFRINDDGTISAFMKDGREFHTEPGGNSTFSIPQLTKISIDNIGDIRKYSLIEHEGLILHTVEFRNGGSLAFSYESDGKLEVLSSSKLTMKSTPEGAVIYSMEPRSNA